MKPYSRPLPLWLLLVLTVGLLVTACGESVESSTSSEDVVVVRVAGSGTATPVVELLAERFVETRSGVRFEFESGSSSGGGIQGVVDGTLDLGLVNRPLEDDEAGLEVEYHPFAVDAMIFAVNEPNQVTGLSTNDVRALYGGAVVDWSEFGGEQLPAILLGRDADESATKLFFTPLMDGAEVVPTVAVLSRSSEMIDALATTPGAIGFTTLGSLSLGDVDNVKPVALDGVVASPASLADGSYPWAMTFAVVSPRGGTSDAVDEFIAFLTSSRVQEMLAIYGYAPAQ